jgi:hypothetical protein
VLPCEDHERVVRRPRTGGGASVGEVSPVAGELGVVVWLSTSLLVITVYEAVGVEWSLDNVVARQ